MASVSDKKPFIFQKQPAEEEIIGIDFSRRIPPTVTISSYIVVAELHGNTPEKIADSIGPHLQVRGTAVSRKTLSCIIYDGQDSLKYRVTFKVTLSDSQVKEDEIFINVIEE